MDPNLPIDKQNIDNIPIENTEYCDLCEEPTNTEDNESRVVVVGDESLLLCEGCAEHYIN